MQFHIAVELDHFSAVFILVEKRNSLTHELTLEHFVLSSLLIVACCWSSNYFSVLL